MGILRDDAEVLLVNLERAFGPWRDADHRVAPHALLLLQAAVVDVEPFFDALAIARIALGTSGEWSGTWKLLYKHVAAIPTPPTARTDPEILRAMRAFRCASLAVGAALAGAEPTFRLYEKAALDHAAAFRNWIQGLSNGHALHVP